MLNLFPIQFLALGAYFILRIVTALVLLHLGLKHLQARRELYQVIKLPVFPFGKIGTWLLILSELTIAVLLGLGLLTQLAALLLLAMAIKFIILHRHFKHPTIPGRLTYLLLAGISLSLLITGAGIFAFDLPI